MRLSQKEIDIILDASEKFDIKKIILFGSFARGDAKRGSDIDLAVDKNSLLFKDYLENETDLIYFVDVLEFTKLKGKILEEVKKGIVLKDIK